MMLIGQETKEKDSENKYDGSYGGMSNLTNYEALWTIVDDCMRVDIDIWNELNHDQSLYKLKKDCQNKDSWHPLVFGMKVIMSDVQRKNRSKSRSKKRSNSGREKKSAVNVDTGMDTTAQRTRTRTSAVRRTNFVTKTVTAESTTPKYSKMDNLDASLVTRIAPSKGKALERETSGDSIGNNGFNKGKQREKECSKFATVAVGDVERDKKKRK